MDLATFISTLVGAIIGSLSSIGTLIVQSHYDSKREMKKLAFEIARDDFHFRIDDKSGRAQALPASVLIFYYDRLIDLASKGQLNPGSIRQLLRDQAELNESIEREVASWRAEAGKGKGHDA